ncbi:VIT domain-containing protein [Nannocystis bainbridge]|uniref:VIT domain-containing protein n=1 Tax=Nannocystis bainbridge TaxID=2995303 RepID=A0ABT5E1S6_9BACT|nr:VIT domain-containing protein [Nannocystis bainbridge]MDC0719834.1 VIT domain-containing protein [Nannocystis bainbridge]
MVRPLALSSFWSLLALACTPVADGDDPELDTPDDLAEAPGPVHISGPEASTCSGPRPTELTAIDPAAEPDQGQLMVAAGDRWLGLPLQAIRYDTVVVGTLAETTVTQTFVNPRSERLEAIYSFPLPDDAAIDDYWIRIGSRSIHGLLKRYAEAQRTFDQARKAGRTAALLTQERPNLFTQAVTNIGPGETIEVEIHLVQPLRQRAGRYSLALPTVVGPRYSPPGAVADASRITPPVLPAGVDSCVPVEIAVDIDTTLPVADVASKLHAVAVTQRPQGVSVALARGPARADRDFELSWRLAGPQPRAELMAQKTGDNEGYFALTLQPPQGFDAGSSRPRELVFVVDVSGSMRGAPLDTAKAAIERALAGMRKDDTFNLITFASSALSFEPASVANTEDNRQRALDFLANARNVGGSTEMLTGVAAALDAPKDPERLRMVLFMTDGYIGNEVDIFTALEAARRDARVFALGVGSSVNRFLVDGLGRVGHGSATVVGPGEAPAAVVDEFYESIDRPVLTDISIDWGGLAVADVAPAQLPDLFAGQPLVLHGRYTGALAGNVKIRGKLGGADIELPVRLADARVHEHDGLASMWARKRIDDLSNYPFNQVPGPLFGPRWEAVVSLAVKHRILTDYTAFVAVDERRERQPDGTLRTVQIPVESPFGLDMSPSDEGSLGLGSTGLIGQGGGGGGGGIGYGHNSGEKYRRASGSSGQGGSGSGSGYGRGAGAGFGGRGTRVPTVRQAKPEVQGSLDQDLIRRVVRAHINEVRACYESGLQRDPNLRGRVALDLQIEKNGVVSRADVAEDTLAVNTVAPCIAAAARGWRFPGNSGGVVTVRYPFVLEPG